MHPIYDVSNVSISLYILRHYGLTNTRACDNTNPFFTDVNEAVVLLAVMVLGLFLQRWPQVRHRPVDHPQAPPPPALYPPPALHHPTEVAFCCASAEILVNGRTYTPPPSWNCSIHQDSQHHSVGPNNIVS